MKTFMVHIILWLSPFLAVKLTAQEYMENRTAELYLYVCDRQGGPVPFRMLTITDKSDSARSEAVTNRAGKVSVTVFRNHTYLIATGKGTPVEVTIPGNVSRPVVQKIMITPEELTDDHGFDTIRPQFTRETRGNLNQPLVVVQLTGPDGTPQGAVPVALVAKEMKKVFATTTDASGMAHLVVFPGMLYHMNVAEVADFDSIEVPPGQGLVLEAEYTYLPTLITEDITHDTVIQTFPMHHGPTSSRGWLEVYVHDFAGEPLPGEDVFLDVQGAPTVYRAVTNPEGKARFMVPHGRKYLLHLTYERNIFEIDYHNKTGKLVTDECGVGYRGTLNIENYYAGPIRDKDGFVVRFMSSEVKRIGFDKSKVKRTSGGFEVEFGGKSHTPPPMVTPDDNLIAGGGLYSRELYSFGSKTGTFNWGLELSDNGASASVYDDGYLLITTESCTLYAIDAKTGNLAWSKWLGPYIRSTPTVANGKVFVVYPNGFLSGDKLKDQFALICFELKSGNILWQNHIDQEPLGAPVSTAGQLYVTTLAGNLFHFDALSGKKLHEITDGSTKTPPTIINGRVFVGRQKASASGMVTTGMYDAATFAYVGNFPMLEGSIIPDTLNGLSLHDMMNFSMGRVTGYKGKAYHSTSRTLACSNPAGMNHEWTLDIHTLTGNQDDVFASSPVIVNNRLVAATRSGQVFVLDPATGRTLQRFSTGGRINAQPTVQGGWIYSGTSGGNLVACRTGDPLLTGWPMWSLNGGHNPVVEK